MKRKIGKVRATVSYRINLDPVCPRCGWQVASDNGLIVPHCKICGQNLVHFEKETGPMPEYTVYVNE